jgi:hypothetical protein
VTISSTAGIAGQQVCTAYLAAGPRPNDGASGPARLTNERSWREVESLITINP